MKTVKKILIPLAALLTLSVLCASVSAINFHEYYMVGFYGEAEGLCHVSVSVPPSMPADTRRFEGIPPPNGKGGLYIGGLAIASKENDNFELLAQNADGYDYLSEVIWTRSMPACRMRVSFNNGEKLTVWMWSSDDTDGVFTDPSDEFDIGELSVFGCWKREGVLQFISGMANVEFYYTGLCWWNAEAELFLESGHVIRVAWDGGGGPPEYLARTFKHRVTVWGPIPWHPDGVPI